MSSLSIDDFIRLIPRACEWARVKEASILSVGTALNKLMLEEAKCLRIVNPEKIRILLVDKIPLPDDVELRNAAQQIKLITPDTKGLTLNYGIFICKDSKDDQRLLIHELVHTSQYERLGGINPFLQCYLRECIEHEYKNAPMEIEAKERAAKWTPKKVTN